VAGPVGASVSPSEGAGGGGKVTASSGTDGGRVAVSVGDGGLREGGLPGVAIGDSQRKQGRCPERDGTTDNTIDL
jgi:hypothetical protein